jgi:hypothetical protein
VELLLVGTTFFWVHKVRFDRFAFLQQSKKSSLGSQLFCEHPSNFEFKTVGKICPLFTFLSSILDSGEVAAFYFHACFSQYVAF